MYGDDGVGICLAYALSRCCHRAGIDIVWIDRPTIGDTAIFEDYEGVVIIDAIDYNSMKALGLNTNASIILVELDPKRLEEEDIVGLIESADAHTMDPTYMVSLAYSAGLFEGKAYLLAIPVENIEFGYGLSEEVKARAIKALDILEEVTTEKYNATIRCQRDCIKSILDSLCGNPLSPL